jgi:hypothetical protein
VPATSVALLPTPPSLSSSISSSVIFPTFHQSSLTGNLIPPFLSPLLDAVLKDLSSDSSLSGGDIFPLPLVSVPAHFSSSSSRRCKARSTRSHFHSITYNDLVCALNSLYSSFYSTPKSSNSPHSSTVGIKNTTNRISSFLHLSVSSFLRGCSLHKVSGASTVVDSFDFPIFSSFDSYLSSPSLVPINAAKVSLPSSRSPVPLVSLLPEDLASIYSSPSLLSSPLLCLLLLNWLRNLLFALRQSGLLWSVVSMIFLWLTLQQLLK